MLEQRLSINGYFIWWIHKDFIHRGYLLVSGAGQSGGRYIRKFS